MLKVSLNQLLTAHSLADNAGHTWGKLTLTELYELADYAGMVDVQDVNTACVARQVRVFGYDDITDWGVTAPALTADGALVCFYGKVRWIVATNSEVTITVYRDYQEPDFSWVMQRLGEGWSKLDLESYVRDMQNGVPILEGTYKIDPDLGGLMWGKARTYPGTEWIGYSLYHVDSLTNALNAVAGPVQAARAVAHLYNRA